MTNPHPRPPAAPRPSVTEQAADLQAPLDLDPTRRVVRLERQITGLQRQLEHRIRQVAHLEREVEELRSAPRADADVLARAHAYERLAEQPWVKVAVRSRDRLRHFRKVLFPGPRR